MFKVTDNIYQVRGFDFANMTFIKGKTGWIVLYELATTNKYPDSSNIKITGDVDKWNTFLKLYDTINQSFNIMTPVSK